MRGRCALGLVTLVAACSAPEPDAAEGHCVVSPYEVQARLMERRAELQTCYADALQWTPRARGRLPVSVAIDAGGRVIRVEPGEHELPIQMVECVAEQLRTLRFIPREEANPACSFSHTLLFSAGER